MNDGDQLSNGGSDYSTQTNVAKVKRIWVRRPEERPTTVTLSMDDSSSLSSDDVEETLNGHLNNFHEDLMDVTLSDMMNKHLMMLGEDGDENSEGEVESLSPDFVLHPVDHDLLLSVSMKDLDKDDDSDTSGGELNPEDTTIANQTFIFMSTLEQEFDQQAISSGVPSLLEETIPMNNFADITFIDYGCVPGENEEGTELEQLSSGRILLPVLRGPQGQSAQEEKPQELKSQSAIHSPLDSHQSSILDEFLRYLPSLPLSLELQVVSEQFLSQPLTAQAASLPPPRLITLPAPIITSREQCKQLLERKAGRAHHWPVAVHLQEQPLPSPDHTPGSDSNGSVFSTPLTSYPPTSATGSEGTVSTYGSPREDFTLSSAPASSRQESDTIAIQPPVACPKKATTNVHAKARAKSDQQPLDMIIIRPTRPTSLNAEDSCPSSPWSSLSSAASNSSSTSSFSSWSWSWPSSSSKTTESTNTPSPLKHQDHKPRLPTTSCSHPLLDIRSRSMSSLMKHQNGWLGFQVLDIRLMASGRNHIVVVTKSNQVYSCWETDNDRSGGLNTIETSIDDTLGRSTRTENGSGFIQDTTHQPGLVEFTGTDWQPTTLASIVKVVCSDHGTFVLTENGDLWGWGSFEDSQGKKTSILKGKASSRPIQICSQKIVSVACGRNHILILTIDGDVISWGVNTCGQLGRKVEQAQESDLSPYFIEDLPPRMIGIGAGKTFSFAWDEERLYGWGDNTFGQLGCPARSKPHQRQDGDSVPSKVIAPKEISLHWKGKSIKQVQGGERHSVILTFSGLVIAMGNDDYGQLGVTSTPTTSSTSSPTSNTSTDPSDSRSSSMSSTWSNIDLEPSNGADYPTKRKTRFYPSLVRIGPGVSEISCGDLHTATCSDNGRMFVWGQGCEGVMMIHNNDPMMEYGGYKGSTASPVTPRQARLNSAVGQLRRVVAVSTMRQASIALVH
ncbi:hypothetical protein BG005_004514 [Podila minutissima]|nr:hypothetical protein BG005_004514 [Podila minutissima]